MNPILIILILIGALIGLIILDALLHALFASENEWD